MRPCNCSLSRCANSSLPVRKMAAVKDHPFGFTESLLAHPALQEPDVLVFADVFANLEVASSPCPKRHATLVLATELPQVHPLQGLVFHDRLPFRPPSW